MAEKNRFNPSKLHLSKWTAVKPQNKEKHFLVTKLLKDDEGVVQQCVLEAVISHREHVIHWQILTDSGHWKQGWR
ncbi:TIGR02450 family Trp-rich protein [Amphritea pacifica]|uniref:TIGR02450 family Trp-rich protein n=1 Tax=Amphritea pacifica TaxID=2811233 RepID=A0ABS2W738_9GAMM|nr:TIGR02450 family Trp-rich protein [Amphritea pacifica]MBN0987519.1 TIGR02450 family Trp-rich protein [Amphritea pacifica]MBN1005158.1 TIGR02450 family Trp-rich protein [Amphritea pacifica]